MAESIDQVLKQSKNAKTKHIKWILLFLIILGISLSIFIPFSKKNTEEKVYVPEVYTVKKGDIRSITSSDGNIINPDIVNLSFLINGTLNKLHVKEGDRIEEGQLLAELDKRDLVFDLQSAQNDVNISLQNIKAKEASITDLDIINAESDLDSTQRDIETRKKSSQQQLEQSFDDAQLVIESTFRGIKESLQEIDYIFGINRHYSDRTISHVAFNDTIHEIDVKNNFKNITQELSTLKNSYEERKWNMEQSDISRTVWKLNLLTEKTESMLDTAITIFKSARSSSAISDNTISSALSSLQGFQSKTQSLSSSLNNTKQNIDTNFLNLQNTLVDIDNSLKDAQLKVENAEKTVYQSNISKQTSVDIQYAQLQQSKLKVEKASYNLSLARLTAPKTGTIIEVNGSVGESMKSDNSSADNAFIKILSDANFTTEVYVEEIDIAHITKDQKAIVTLNALADVELEGSVSYIASTATADNNGIVTYLVRIDIVDTQNLSIREGMSTYVDFVLGEAIDVVMIPSSAVINNRFVTNEAGERLRVEVGFSDGDFTEITSGLNKGDTIISNPQTNNTSRKREGERPREGRTFSEERLQKMKDSGFTDKELEQLQKGELTDEIRKKMQDMRESGQEGNSLTGTNSRGPGGRGSGGGRR